VLLFVTAAATDPAKILMMGCLFGLAKAMMVAPAGKNSGNGN